MHRNMDSGEKYKIILSPLIQIRTKNFEISVILKRGWNLIFHTEFTFSI